MQRHGYQRFLQLWENFEEKYTNGFLQTTKNKSSWKLKGEKLGHPITKMEKKEKEDQIEEEKKCENKKKKKVSKKMGEIYEDEKKNK